MTAFMSLYVPHQMEALHSSLSSRCGYSSFLNCAWNFPLLWLEQREGKENQFEKIILGGLI